MEHKEKNFVTNKQLGLRCPGCVNTKCGPTKEFYGDYVVQRNGLSNGSFCENHEQEKQYASA